ncbi:MAG: type II toxin-antitoxin system HicB family antitoxin [Dehalococcoidia bacterium]|nr:type II toxin-antitoxin system HicB family antitoxin [Dehalococcoidia bacterium]
MTYDVVLEPSDEGGYTVYVPSLRGCVSEGDTEEEALENIRDAIGLWLDSWEQVAADKGSVLKKVVVDR